MKEELIIKFITLQQQFRILHWQTKSHAKHVAYGGIYDSLDGFIDEFIEVYMGKYGRINFESGEGTIILKNTDSLDLNSFLKDNISWLKEMSQKLNDSNDSDLLNIRDEVIASLNKLRYLLTLK